MNADALVLALVALADLAVLVYLRRRHHRRERARRMMRSLQFAISREIASTATVRFAPQRLGPGVPGPYTAPS
jgi:hypothetical protein